MSNPRPAVLNTRNRHLSNSPLVWEVVCEVGNEYAAAPYSLQKLSLTVSTVVWHKRQDWPRCYVHAYSLAKAKLWSDRQRREFQAMSAAAQEQAVRKFIIETNEKLRIEFEQNRVPRQPPLPSVSLQIPCYGEQAEAYCIEFLKRCGWMIPRNGYWYDVGLPGEPKTEYTSHNRPAPPDLTDSENSTLLSKVSLAADTKNDSNSIAATQLQSKLMGCLVQPLKKIPRRPPIQRPPKDQSVPAREQRDLPPQAPPFKPGTNKPIREFITVQPLSRYAMQYRKVNHSITPHELPDEQGLLPSSQLRRKPQRPISYVEPARTLDPAIPNDQLRLIGIEPLHWLLDCVTDDCESGHDFGHCPECHKCSVHCDCCG